eukprot:gene26020-biopygen17909
MSRGGCSRPG